MKSRDSTRARRYRIIESISQSGNLSFAQMRALVASWQKISDPTLRKDIEEISQLPVVLKNSHGGLLSRSKGLFGETYFDVNLKVDAVAKGLIARRLVEGKPPFEGSPLINRSGDSCVIGPGTTTLAVLCVLGEYPGVEVLTTNLGIVNYPDLLTKPSFHLSGGWCLSPVASLVGMAAVRNINAFVANTSIIGVSGLSVSDDTNEIHLYCHHEVQLPVKQALVKNRKNVIVVTCGRKLDRKDAWEFSTVSHILKESNFYLFTDGTSENISRKFRNSLCKLSKHAGNDYVAKLIELKKDNLTK